jgi:hypothetical protein
MAGHTRPTITKRQKERKRLERVQAKQERRAQREAERRERPDPAPGEDPDIAGIVPGPQPPRADD